MVNIKLIQGDCIEKMQELIDEDVKVDLILTDLPYGVTANKWDNIIPFDEMWMCVHNLTKNAHVPIIFFGNQPFTTKLINSNFKEFRYEWIYQKTSGGNFAALKYQPLKVHEHILVFGKKTPYYYPIMEEREEKGKIRNKYSKTHYTHQVSENYHIKSEEITKNYPLLRNPISIRKFNNRKKKDRGLHPTQKPVELLEYLIKTYTKEGDLVLDFTMGSGSTGVACQNTNRNFIGIELEEEYYKIAEQRLEENSKQQKLL